MNYKKEILQIQNSLNDQSISFQNTLILNPVENIPDQMILEPCTSFIHGLYNTDTIKTDEDKISAKILFSGREQITKDINKIYSMWSEILGGEAVSMRLLSGLHAHIIIFMSITDIGQKVMALPEKAGGHVSSYAILKRLGLDVIDMPYDSINMRINKEQCISDIETFKPDIIFIDRSEGLVYEDFTWLGEYKFNHSCYKIFDASQYLTNIICNDYINPFDMGFDLILSTLHKNLPGPQRALVCSKRNDTMWKKLKAGISTYVSNMHAFSIYSAGLILDNYNDLKNLSKEMLSNACKLEEYLATYQVPVIQRTLFGKDSPTHHCWVGPMEQRQAYNLFILLEQLGLLTNYRLLPYDLGYGLRLGTSCATKCGLSEKHIPELAYIINKAYSNGYSIALKNQATDLIKKIKTNY